MLLIIIIFYYSHPKTQLVKYLLDKRMEPGLRKRKYPGIINCKKGSYRIFATLLICDAMFLLQTFLLWIKDIIKESRSCIREVKLQLDVKLNKKLCFYFCVYGIQKSSTIDDY